MDRARLLLLVLSFSPCCPPPSLSPLHQDFEAGRDAKKMDKSIESLAGSAPPSLLLMGMRGAGKTTLGKLASEHLRVPFVDADELFSERHAPHSAKTFVAEHGWAAFRAEETTLLVELLDQIQKQGKPMVISLGGGIVEEEANRRLLRRCWSCEKSGQFNRSKRIAVVHIFREVDSVLLDVRGLPSWGVSNGREVWDRRRPWFRESCECRVLLFNMPADVDHSITRICQLHRHLLSESCPR